MTVWNLPKFTVNMTYKNNLCSVVLVVYVFIVVLISVDYLSLFYKLG